MYIIIWQFSVEPQYRQNFLEYYGPQGKWVKLFKKSTNYISTDLLIRNADQHAFLTIDKWKDEQAYVDFLKENELVYKKLDLACEKFTLNEKLVGKYFSIGQ